MSTSKHRKAPIGVFDSGVGGLTVLSSIKSVLPDYDYIYLGDNARAPYGTRSFEVVYEYTLEAVKKLFSMGCELVILACNTASAKALRSIQQNDLPLMASNKRVLGVIRPTSELIGRLSNTKHIGVFATEGTVKSASYVIEIAKFFSECKVTQLACPLWVPLIENNEIHTPGSEYYIRQYTEGIMQADPKIDTILLGCTHYPVIEKDIQALLPKHVKVIAQGEIVAQSLELYLARHPEIEEKCAKNATTSYYTTESPEEFAEKAKIILGINIKADRIEL